MKKVTRLFLNYELYWVVENVFTCKKYILFNTDIKIFLNDWHQVIIFIVNIFLNVTYQIIRKELHI